MLFQHPHTEVAKIIAFLKQIYQTHGKQNAVIAVSGGIDSALSLTLLASALPKDHIFPILLPFGDQTIEDSQAICEFNQIPKQNISIVDIKPAVEKIVATRAELAEMDDTQQQMTANGNIMARVRMIFVYDLAKAKDALVCGTENKSEKYLAYFTRFGDEASDIEPIQHLYKTQVRQLAEELKVPQQFITKSPSAGLWQGQTDEDELGFSYEQADKVMEQYIDQKKTQGEIQAEGVSAEIVKKVIARIQSQHFKHEVPYIYEQ